MTSVAPSMGEAVARAHEARGRASDAFSNPERVTIRGYDGDAMEPFVTRDGRYLLFNSRNDPAVNTDLYYAERIDDVTFEFLGEIVDVNTSALEGVPTADRSNVFYFVSPRSYGETFSTIYRGRFDQGRVSDVELVSGISRQQPGWVNFDVDVSASGETLYYVESHFGPNGPETADIAIATRTMSGFTRSADSDRIMKRVNTDALEYAACLSGDELTLYFTRWGLSPALPPAIYKARRSSIRASFRKPKLVSAITGFVEGPALSTDEKSLYFHKLDGNRFTIFRVSRP